MAIKEISINGGTIPISVEENNGIHTITVDGVEWVKTENITHAAVLFNMMADHITEYMDFKKI